MGGGQWCITSYDRKQGDAHGSKTPSQRSCHYIWGGSQSKVLGLGKVVVSPDVSIVDIMLVKTLSYNLLSVLQLVSGGRPPLGSGCGITGVLAEPFGPNQAG